MRTSSLWSVPVPGQMVVGGWKGDVSQTGKELIVIPVHRLMGYWSLHGPDKIEVGHS